MQRIFDKQKTKVNFKHEFKWKNNFSKSFHFNPQSQVILKGKPLKQLIIGGVEKNVEKIANEINTVMRNYKRNSLNDLIINNSEIETLTSDLFKSISFKEIIITKSAKKLNHIELNAFSNLKHVKRLKIQNGLPRNESLENFNSFLNSFENIEEIYITSPLELKGKLKLPKLNFLIVNGSNLQDKLESIDDFLFYDCPNLVHIDLSNNNLKKITKKLFKFKTESELLLTLDLTNNQLIENSFEKSSLSINRPVKLILNQNPIKYLAKNIFSNFLNINSENEIYLYEDLVFEYENQENFWLLNNSKILDERIYGIKKLKKFSDNVYIDENSKEVIIKGNHNIDLKMVIDSLAEFNFGIKTLKIENKSITSIEENSFGGFNFKVLLIVNCEKLKNIHKNAFGENSKNILKIFILKGIANLTSTQNNDYDLIELINSLTNCEQIVMSSFGETIYSIKLSKLKQIILDGQYSNCKIKNVENNTFYECDNLELINLSWNQIKMLNEFSFRFKSCSNSLLDIDLRNNLLYDSSFDSISLNNLKRPVRLWLKGNNITDLKRNIFEDFFKYEKNQIVINNNIINFSEASKFFDKDFLE